MNRQRRILAYGAMSVGTVVILGAVLVTPERRHLQVDWASFPRIPPGRSFLRRGF